MTEHANRGDGPTNDRRNDQAVASTVETIMDSLPAALKVAPSKAKVEALARELATALLASERRFAASGEHDDDEMRRINDAADRIHALDREFTLSDVDRTWRARAGAYGFNTLHMIERFGGSANHEATWDGAEWKNWNRLVRNVPAHYRRPEPPAGGLGVAGEYESVRKIVRESTPLRVVAGGHAFNDSASTGGLAERPTGTLLCLDLYSAWRKIAPAEASSAYGLASSSPNTLVRVQAGIRLRDFNESMWEQGLAFPLCGSTDTQSLGGLVASDLHGTGRHRGFLAEQIRELKMIRADGALIVWRRGPAGWTTNEPTPRTYPRLPVAGALGMLGVVVELVVELVPAFFMEKNTYFADRAEIEADLPRLVAAHDHINIFYPCGGPSVRTIQVNTMSRTDRRPSALSALTRFAGEMGDHVLASYLPSQMFGLAGKSVHDDPVLRMMNKAKPNVLPSPAAFSRRLYYLHDEVEYAFPVEAAVPAIAKTVDLLRDEELHSLVEMRFTPDCAQSLIGPGNVAAGRGGAVWFGLATAIGEHSRARILAVFEKFDRVMRPFGGRPHLGKQTAKNEADMTALIGPDWTSFQALRREWDPTGRFLPPENDFLNKLFR